MATKMQTQAFRKLWNSPPSVQAEDLMFDRFFNKRLFRRHPTLARLYMRCVIYDTLVNMYEFLEDTEWDVVDHNHAAHVVRVLKEASKTVKYGDMLQFVRGVLKFYMDLEFVSEEQIVERGRSLSSSPEKEEFSVGTFQIAQALGESIFNCAKSASDWFTSGFKKAGKTIQEWFVEILTRAFDHAFGPLAEVARNSFSWLKKTFERMKEWVSEIMQMALSWFQAIEESLYYALGLISMTCIIALVERFLVSAGLLTYYVGAPTLFVTMAVGLLCAKHVTTVTSKFEGVGQLSVLIINLVKNFMKNIMPGSEISKKRCEGQNDEFGDEVVLRPKSGAQFSMSTLLESLATTLDGWSSTSLGEIGRTCQAFSHIKSGITSLKDMIIYVCSATREALSKTLGIESKLLTDMSMVIGQDVPAWLAECEALILYATEFKTNSRDVLDRLTQLLARGRDMRNSILKSADRGSASVLILITKTVDKLTELHSSLVLTGNSTTRMCPFFLFFHGAAGTGKSSLAQHVAKDWLEYYNMTEDDIYARNGQDAFWSQYRRQAIVMYDDFGAVKKDVSNEAEIIGVVSCNALPLTMAGLNEKGMHFDSRLVIASSNFLGASPESGILDHTAYERRRHLVVEVSLKPNVPYNPANPMENQRYVLKSSRSPFVPVRTFDNYDDLWAFILNSFEEHERKERAFLDNLDMPKTHHSKQVEQLVNATLLASRTLPPSIKDFLDIKNQEEKSDKVWHFLIYYEGTAYFWEVGGSVSYVGSELKLTEKDREYLDSSALKLAFTYQQLTKNFSDLNPLCVHYASEVVKKGWINREMKVSHKCTDAYLREQLEELPDWQKAYLYVLGDMCSSEKPNWFASIKKKALLAMQEAYLCEAKQWPLAMKVVVGLLAFSITGGAIYMLFRKLWMCGTGAAFVATASTVFQGQSEMPNRNRSDYRFRNAPVKFKTWQQGQASFGDSDLWVMENCLATLHYAGATLSVCVLPGRTIVGVHHFLRRIPQRALVQIDNGHGAYKIVWDQASLYQCDGSELSVYTSSQLQEAPKSLASRIISDPELLPKNFRARFLSYKKNANSSEMVPEIAEVNVNKKDQLIDICDGEYLRTVPRFLAYDAPTEAGDCGSLLVATIKGKAMLVGIHVSGANGKGSACYVPNYEPWFPTTMQAQSEFSKHCNEWEEPIIKGPCCRIVGQMKQGSELKLTNKTSLLETPVEYHLNLPCDKVPSVLKQGDPRLIGTVHEQYNPFTTGMEKYANEAGPFDESLLSSVCDEISEEWLDASDDFSFAEATLDEAINGVEGLEYFDPLVLQTSEGFPYVLDRPQGEKGKYRYFEGEPGNLRVSDPVLMQNIVDLEVNCANYVPEIVGIECTKDERLPKRKIFQEPKTRLFTVLPMHYNIVVRRKFLYFVRFLMKKRAVFPCQVGINPYSREWNDIATRLLEKGANILCCDYSRFDGFMSKVLMKHIAAMINKVCGGGEQLCKQRENLLMACCSRYGICGKMVYRVEAGIPSGFPMTVIVNSILNEVLVRYVYKLVMVERPIIAASFNQFVTMVTYGDDNLISVSPQISGIFDGARVQDEMRKCGIKITDGVDKTLPTLAFRRLDDCDFLKRKFKLRSDGIWVGPMETESLWPQLHFVRCQALELNEAYLANLNSVLRELWLVSKEECHNLRRKALTQLKWIKSSEILTLAQIEAFYDEQLGLSGKAPRYAESVDIFENMALMEPLRRGEVPVGNFEIVPGVFVSCEHIYEYQPKHFTISIKTRRNLKEEDGFVLDYVFGNGRGGLPTKTFVDNFILNTRSNLSKKFRMAYAKREEKPIYLVSQNSCIPAMVIAVMFLLSNKAIDRQMSNSFLSHAMQCVSTLGYLPDFYPNLF